MNPIQNEKWSREQRIRQIDKELDLIGRAPELTPELQSKKERLYSELKNLRK